MMAGCLSPFQGRHHHRAKCLQPAPLLRSQFCITAPSYRLRAAPAARAATSGDAHDTDAVADASDIDATASSRDDASYDALGLLGVRRGGSGGRRAHRHNPLGYSALLSSYNARVLGDVVDGAHLRLDALDRRTGYRFRHREAAGLALLHPRVSVAEYQACPLTHSHLAVLGEDLLRLAAVELAWTVLEDAGPLVTDDTDGGDAGRLDGTVGGTRPPGVAGPAAAIAEAVASFLSARGFPVDKAARVAAAAAKQAGDEEQAEGAVEARAEGQGASAALLNRVAATVTGSVHLLVERWRVEEHMYDFLESGASNASKLEKAAVAKALVAAMYLDGGYAGAVRLALAPLVVEALLGAGGGPQQADLHEVGRRLERMLQQHHGGKRHPLPRDTDDLHINHHHHHRGNSRREEDSATQAPVSQRGRDDDASRDLRAMLAGLAAHGNGYEPRDTGFFLALSDLWYSYLHSFSPSAASLSGASLPAGPERQRAIAAAAARARGLLVLGRSVYLVAVAELVLEEAVVELAADPDGRQALGLNSKLRRTAADAARKEREAFLGERLRLTQMEVGLGLDVGGHVVGEGQGGDMYGYGGDELRADSEEGLGSVMLARCADGVLGAVMLEGGMRHARAVVRGLVAVSEAWTALRLAEVVGEEDKV